MSRLNDGTLQPEVTRAVVAALDGCPWVEKGHTRELANSVAELVMVGLAIAIADPDTKIERMTAAFKAIESVLRQHKLLLANSGTLHPGWTGPVAWELANAAVNAIDGEPSEVS